MIGLSSSVQFFASILFISFLSFALSQQSTLGVIYNTKCKQDGNFQASLFRGTFLGLMEADVESSLHPLFIDVGDTNSDFGEGIGRIITQNVSTIVSLLSTAELSIFIQEFPKYNNAGQSIKIFTPRSIESLSLTNNSLEKSKQLTVVSLQSGLEARVVALLHRVLITRIRSLTPILDDESQLPLLQTYQSIASKLNSELKFHKTIFITHFNNHKISNNARLLSMLASSTPSNGTTSQEGEGILLLSSKWLPDSTHGFSSEEHFFRWFSHHPVHEQKSGSNVLFGMYTAQYVGSTNWDTALRRNVIRDFSNSSDPTPVVLSTILAFDSATLAVSYVKQKKIPTPFSGLSGDIVFDTKGYRVGDFVFVGISALSFTSESTQVKVLQNSTWILEDLVQIRRKETGQFELIDYQVATSSLISRTKLIVFAEKIKQSGYDSCTNSTLQVTAHDPFTHVSYRYTFTQHNLPDTLVIPNQLGYGFKLFCQAKEDFETRMDIACTPDSMSIGASVHCFQSRVRIREKRTYSDSISKSRDYNHFYINSRDDSSNPVYSSFNLQPPDVSDQMNSVNYMDPTVDSTKGSSSYSPMSSTEESTTTEEATTTEAPVISAPTSKLPDLRGILKNAKPFVGGCIGATTGCSVCVVVLGRLPLGALPAACTGPCFVTTFANCGALLGRTFAETTVICTELFKQGLLDLDTFLVDSEFGQLLSKESGITLKGYQVLATPIVEMMKSSETFTKVVELFASPWALHMTHLMGRTSNFSWLGCCVHNVGMMLCTITGHLVSALENILVYYGLLIGGIILTLVVILNTKNK